MKRLTQSSYKAKSNEPPEIESGSLIKQNLPCFECSSSDAMQVYENVYSDGHKEVNWKCFSCGGFGDYNQAIEKYGVPVGDDGYNALMIDVALGEDGLPKPADLVEAEPMLGLMQGGDYTNLDDPNAPWGYRGIDWQVCRRYGVTNIQDTHLVLPYTNASGEIIAQKVRSAKFPKGIWHKTEPQAHKKVGFFGQQLFSKRRRITIVFGEMDAMATYQMLNKKKNTDYAVISVSKGDSGAMEEFRTQFSYLYGFDEIVLIPDNDGGKCWSVIPTLAKFFPRRTKVVRITKHKDPCDYLKAGDEEAFLREYYDAQPYMSDDIKGLSQIAEALFEEAPVPVARYPWDHMNEILGGVWPGELVTIKAPPGAGKTTFITELADSVRRNTPYKSGLIYLEDTRMDLICRFATIELNKNVQWELSKGTLSQEDKEKAVASMKNMDEGEQVFILEHWGGCSAEQLEETIQEFVLAQGCQFIFFDHISAAIVDGSYTDPERIALDKLVYAIKKLTTGIPEYGPDGEVLRTHQPTVFLITHINDQGDPRGSKVLTQASNTIIDLRRNPKDTEEDDWKANFLPVYIEKNRRLARCGLGCSLFFNFDTGRLEDRTTAFIEGLREENAHEQRKKGTSSSAVKKIA